MTTIKNGTTSDGKNTVLAFLNALNCENFDAARDWVNDDLKFEGVLGTREGADVYIEDMKRMKLKYDLKKVFSDGDDVCILYDITISGLIIFSCGWYHVNNSRIKSFRVVFDPRPLPELQAKK